MQGKVLIANRGEIAIRVMQACRNLGLDYVLVYAAEDRDSMHVRLAESEANAWRIADYLDPNDVLEVADQTGATAIHPGYGFFSENYRFARRVATRGRPLTFIGPSWEALKALGSKINTKRTAKYLKIPTIPGSDKPIYNEVEAEDVAAELFSTSERMGMEAPSVMVKPSAGGGGMGIEEVQRLDDFRRVYRKIRNYAKRQFGDEGVLVEQCLKGFNHVEVQLVCSKHKEIVSFGTRNCTIQSTGRQKRIEVTPGFEPGHGYDFDAEAVTREITAASIKLASYVRYDSVGTFEWLVSPRGSYYLLEVNPRVQVEIGVTARVSCIKDRGPGANLIEEQIRLALGQDLGYEQKDVAQKGAAIEFRLVAEDTRRGFTPSSGTIARLNFPAHDWLTVYTHVPTDRPYTIPSEYDPNLALAIVWGEDLTQARQRGLVLLEETVIEGTGAHGQPIETNLDFLRNNIAQVLRFS
ncbi:MAG: biotin carboxylase N-terminal domain-containing protein [Pseudomonadota bacterium]